MHGKSCPCAMCPPQNPHGLPWNQTQAFKVTDKQFLPETWYSLIPVKREKLLSTCMTSFPPFLTGTLTQRKDLKTPHYNKKQNVLQSRIANAAMFCPIILLQLII